MYKRQRYINWVSSLIYLLVVIKLLMSSYYLIQQLQSRGLIAQITDDKKTSLAKRLAQKPMTLYCGFDPTADSLHLGHLLPLLCLKRFQLAGHRPIVLIGGATGLIGDPSFKATERQLNTVNTVQNWTEKIKRQCSLFLDFDCGDNSAIIINNYDWFGSMNILAFLRNIGKHFSVNQLINKESIKHRLNRHDRGISFTEFSYNLLQSYDFAYLSRQHNVTLQIGGSDQWGNITSGIDLTRRLYKNSVFGLTIPLITKSNGIKFGKTECGSLWLNPNKTSPYAFYQFWINIADRDVYRFLKYFTFLDLAFLSLLEQTDRKSNEEPRAQSILAEEMTRMVHGKEGLATAKRIATSLFNSVITDLTEDDFAQLSHNGIPSVALKQGSDLQYALVTTAMAPSRNQARTMIASNAIAVNGKKQTAMGYIFQETDKLYGRYTLLRRGKRNYCLILWK